MTNIVNDLNYFLATPFDIYIYASLKECLLWVTDIVKNFMTNAFILMKVLSHNTVITIVPLSRIFTLLTRQHLLHNPCKESPKKIERHKPLPN